MSKNHDFKKDGEDVVDDVKNFFKHSKRTVRSFFKGGIRRNRFGGCGRPPFMPFRNPLLCLFFPKIVVGGIILLTLLFCGVSLYGLIIIILLLVIFFII